MIDALCFKKPVIQVKFQNEIHTIPFEKYDTVLTSTISSLFDNIFTILNDDKLRNLGFKPEISFDEGLKSLCS